MKKLILILILIIPIQAYGVTINPGENAVFTFDFDPLVLSQYNFMTYTVSASNPDGAPALANWTPGSLDLFAELGGSPKNISPGASFTPGYNIGITNANADSVYFDDPVSYIKISSFVGGLLVGGIPIGAVDISWIATASAPNIIGIAPSVIVNGSALVSVPEVPIPAAVWLFGTALIGLVGFSKRREAA